MILGPSTKQSNSSPSTKQSQPKGQFNLIEKLGRISSQISIFELLHISPTHKAILEKYLQESSIPHDIDFNQFEVIVGHLTTPH